MQGAFFRTTEHSRGQDGAIRGRVQSAADAHVLSQDGLLTRGHGLVCADEIQDLGWHVRADIGRGHLITGIRHRTDAESATEDGDDAAKLRAQGFDFYDWAEGEVRFVVSWDQPAAEIDAFAAAIAAL